MVVGQQEAHGRPELVSIQQSDGAVADVEPDRVRVEGYPEPVDIERVEEYQGLRSADMAYGAQF
jgi:hypothetical protein